MGRRYNGTVRERAIYWFDNLMSQGMWAKIKLLLLTTLVFVLIMAALTFLAYDGSGKESISAGLWAIPMYVLGKGGALNGTEGSPFYLTIKLLAILYCLFFTAILIGLINQGLRSKMEELGKGQGKVLEEGHTLILGFNDSAFVLLGELIEADLNQRQPQKVVMLDETDQSSMIDAVKKKLGPAFKHPRTQIICRTGSCYGFADLRRCAVESSRAIVINATSDFDTVKAIMACAHVLNESGKDSNPYIVATLHDREGFAESRIAGSNAKNEDWLELLSLNDALARIMVHTSRQPGLSDVFTELFNFTGDEFYIVNEDPCFERFRGKSIAEINRYLQTAYAVGVVGVDGEVNIGHPRETYFDKGCGLIVVEEDDNALRVSRDPAPVVPFQIQVTAETGRSSILILGTYPILNSILAEYADYLAPCSTICVASPNGDMGTMVSDEVRDLLAQREISLSERIADTQSSVRLYGLLDECNPESVLVLTNHDTANEESEDEKTVRLLLYLRDYRNRTERQFSITSEMLLAKNKELVAATEPDDFIIGRHISALLMAQISKERKMASLFESLLSSAGFEVYMKPASWYVPIEVAIDLISAGEAVADRGEVFIGVRQKRNGAYEVADINPPKYENDMDTLKRYTFGEDDYFVVLAEDNTLEHPTSNRKEPA